MIESDRVEDMLMIMRVLAAVIAMVVAGCSGEPVDVVRAADESGDVVRDGTWFEARFAEGRAVYEESCAVCHDPEAGDAPTIGVREDWNDRSNKWVAVLFDHARSGYLAMPAKGGDTGLSDRQVNAAAEYMLTVTYPELPVD